MNLDGHARDEVDNLYDQALALREGLVAEWPNAPENKSDLSLSLLQLGSRRDKDQAEKAYRRAIDLCRQIVREYPSLRLYHQRLLNSTAALIELMRATGRDQDSATVGGQALAFWDQLARDHPKLIECQLFLGQAHELTGQYQQALASYSKAILLDSSHWWGWFWRGLVELKLERWDEALADFSHVIKSMQQSGAAWAYYGRSRAYRGLHQPERALEDLTMATKLWPRLWDVWVWRGIFHLERQEWKMAVADLTEAVERNSSYWPAWFNRAIAHMELKQPDQAVLDLREAMIQGLPNALQTLNNDKRLASLRSRLDFQALRVDAEKSSKK
jgi:tetratricopeptide (TPR) repeat protein